ncbi:hypothetical protein V2G26_001435 [Clonostachys chloroleuca]
MGHCFSQPSHFQRRQRPPTNKNPSRRSSPAETAQGCDESRDDNKKPQGHIPQAFFDPFFSIRHTDDVEESIKAHASALATLQKDDPEYLIHIHQLGESYFDRYSVIHTLIDLERSLDCLEEAYMLATPKYSGWNKLSRSVGWVYYRSYERTNFEENLELAVKMYESLVKTPHEDEETHLRIHYELSVIYTTLYDLSEAQIADDISSDETDSQGILSDGKRYVHLAIKHQEEVIGKIKGNSEFHSNVLNSLATNYLYRYELENSPKDFERGIEKYEEALSMSKPNYPSRYTLLYDAGEGYFWKYKISKHDDDLNTALKYYREAFKLQWISPLSLFDVGYKLANGYAKAEKWRESYETFVQMLVLAPHLFHRSAEYSDKQRLLFTVSGMASMAAAAAIRVEEPIYRVISLLELGRGIITQSIQEMRHDLSQLKDSHPKLVQEYTELSGRLSKQILSDPKDSEGRYEMAERLDAAIGEINTVLGISPYAIFSEEQLMRMAEHGPIVVLNIAVDRCDAIIIEKSQLHTLHLPDLRATDAFQMAQKKIRDHELLEWMWTTTARPILDALGCTSTPSDGNWPHIWWVPTGPFAGLPIHAAGYHSSNSGATVIDRVVSSYSTSLTSLAQARVRISRSEEMPNPNQVVLVAMENTPGLSNLPFTTQEVTEIEGLCNTAGMSVNKPKPLREDVLQALSNCDIFHFAGHGRTETYDLIRGAILLQDWRDKPLIVGDLYEADISGSQPLLAYLSACGTGEVSQYHLQDETIHLMSSFQFAGFPHVIGTLWQVNDETCVHMSVGVYRRILDHGMRSSSVSEALHHASRSLREDWVKRNDFRARSQPDSNISESFLSARSSVRDNGHRDIDAVEESPMYWIPYVHYGP